MTITADELARVRYWVSDTWEPTDLFDDAAVGDVWDRESSADQTDADLIILESKVNVLRTAYVMVQTFITYLSGQPDSFSVGGEYSESRGAAINLLLNRLNDIRRLRDEAVAILDGTGAVQTSLMCRPNFIGR